ncbi:MAG: hypothetical protein VB093_09240 [Propionicimonas sp.]|nr:hypothetical protein [Propionicimonas sp.]
MALVYLRWWLGTAGPWAPPDDEYGPSLRSFAPFVGGLVAIYGVLPAMDWIDLQAVTHPQRRDTLAVGVVLVAFAGVAPLVRWFYEVSDLHRLFIPEVIQLAPARDFLVSGLHTAAVLGASCAMVALLGRRLGPAAGLVCYLGMLTVQGYRLAPGLIPRLGDPQSVVSVIAALLTALLGLVAFRLSRSGARPLIR